MAINWAEGAKRAQEANQRQSIGHNPAMGGIPNFSSFFGGTSTGRFGPGGTSTTPTAPGKGGGTTVPYGYSNNVQANPYLDKAFKYFENLWGKAGELEKETYNKEPAIQDYQRMRAQGMKEAEAASGGRGFGPGTGMSLAQRQGLMQGTEQGAQGLAGNLWNQGLNQRTALLGQMSSILGGLGGVGGNVAANQLGVGQLGLGYSQLGSQTALRQQELELERERASREMQLEAFKATAPWLMQMA